MLSERNGRTIIIEGYLYNSTLRKERVGNRRQHEYIHL